LRPVHKLVPVLHSDRFIKERGHFGFGKWRLSVLRLCVRINHCFRRHGECVVLCGRKGEKEKRKKKWRIEETSIIFAWSLYIEKRRLKKHTFFC
jgi:hypothetical protein